MVQISILFFRWLLFSKSVVNAKPVESFEIFSPANITGEVLPEDVAKWIKEYSKLEYKLKMGFLLWN